MDVDVIIEINRRQYRSINQYCHQAVSLSGSYDISIYWTISIRYSARCSTCPMQSAFVVTLTYAKHRLKPIKVGGRAPGVPPSFHQNMRPNRCILSAETHAFHRIGVNLTADF